MSSSPKTKKNVPTVYLGRAIPGYRVCVNIHSGMSSTHLEVLISTLVTFEEQGLDGEYGEAKATGGGEGGHILTATRRASAHTPRQGDEMCGFNPVELNQDRIYSAGRQPPDFNTTFI